MREMQIEIRGIQTENQRILNYLLVNKIDIFTEQKLNPTEVKQINTVLNGLRENIWLKIAMAAWGESKSESLKADIESLVRRSGRICELIRKKTVKERSFTLVNGEKHYPSGPHG